jgi:hypothetical protein
MLILNCPGLASVLEAGYAAFKELLAESSVTAFGDSETALGAERPDRKRYLEFGSEARPDIPAPMHELRRTLTKIVHERSGELDAALLRGVGNPLSELLDRQRGPVLRLSWYPGEGGGLVNYQHTDIDLFTLLPAATRPGLECRTENGWGGVTVGRSEVLVLPGEFLHHFNGPSAVEHRVVTDGSERISASLFVNADPTLFLEGHGRVGDLFEARLAAVRRTRDDGRG